MGVEVGLEPYVGDTKAKVLLYGGDTLLTGEMEEDLQVWKSLQEDEAESEWKQK